MKTSVLKSLFIIFFIAFCMTQTISAQTCQDVFSLKKEVASGDVSRKVLAETALEREITDEQAEAIDRAHLVGEGEIGKDGINPAKIGNYTRAQLMEKSRILEQAGFSKKDREQLIKQGVVGLGNALEVIFLAPIYALDAVIQTVVYAQGDPKVVAITAGFIATPFVVSKVTDLWEKHDVKKSFYRMKQEAESILQKPLTHEKSMALFEIRQIARRVVVENNAFPDTAIKDRLKQDGFTEEEINKLFSTPFIYTPL